MKESSGYVKYNIAHGLLCSGAGTRVDLVWRKELPNEIDRSNKVDQVIALSSYCMADAMLVERGKE
jgi:hypothetical protein